MSLLDSNRSFKAHNSDYKLRTISSNIIHHPEGRSELRDALTCELEFLSYIDISYKTIRDDNSREQERAYRVYQAEN